MINRRRAFLMAGGAGGPRFIASTTGFKAGAAPSLDISRPAGVVDGDWLVALVFSPGSGALSAPAGWSTAYNNTTTRTIGIFYKVASSEPASWSWTGTGEFIGSVLAYRGASAIDLVGAPSRPAGSSDLHTVTGVTATQKGVLIGGFAIMETTTVRTPPAGMTQRAFLDGGTVSTAVYDLNPSMPGATGDKVIRWWASGIRSGILLQIY